MLCLYFRPYRYHEYIYQFNLINLYLGQKQLIASVFVIKLDFVTPSKKIKVGR